MSSKLAGESTDGAKTPSKVLKKGKSSDDFDAKMDKKPARLSKDLGKSATPNKRLSSSSRKNSVEDNLGSGPATPEPTLLSADGSDTPSLEDLVEPVQQFDDMVLTSEPRGTPELKKTPEPPLDGFQRATSTPSPSGSPQTRVRGLANRGSRLASAKKAPLPRDELELGLEACEEAVPLAVAEAKAVLDQDMKQIKVLVQPHALLLHSLEAASILLKGAQGIVVSQEWPALRTQLVGGALVRAMESYVPQSLTRGLLSTLNAFLESHPYMTTGDVTRASRIGGPVTRWILLQIRMATLRYAEEDRVAQEKFDAEQAVLRAQETEVEENREMNSALYAAQAATERALTLNYDDLVSEVKRLANPPAALLDALEGICVVLGDVISKRLPSHFQLNEWKGIRMAIVSGSLLEDVRNFDREAMTKARLRKIQTFIASHKNFSPDVASRNSKVAGELVSWCLTQVSYVVEKYREK